jgi:Zn-finger nucleic acid-binding protein
MICQNCGASVRLDRDQNLMICDYCRSQCTPPVDENGFQITGQTACPCPVCSTQLSNARIEFRDLLYCTACHGTLVSMDHFMPLIDDLRDHRDRAAALLTPRPGASSSGGLDCPLCKRAMDHHAYGGGDAGDIMIDACEACSQIWLDRVTLGKLVLTPAPETWTDAEPDGAAELARRVASLARQLMTRSG